MRSDAASNDSSTRGGLASQRESAHRKSSVVFTCVSAANAFIILYLIDRKITLTLLVSHEFAAISIDFVGEVKIAGNFFATAFSILEEQPMDMLLGLDMLKRHQV